MVVLGLDPGKVNFGYSVVETNSEGKYRVLECGVLKTTVTELKVGLSGQVAAFKKQMSDIVSRNHVTHIVGERFVSRGLLGALSEYVNLMLGICSCLCPDFCLIIPAQWKNAANKHICLVDYYKHIKVPAHIVDSTMIAIYYIDKYFDKVPFADFDNLRATRICSQILRNLQ